MKFFAILRDSVREALDAKGVYFVFGLTAVFLAGIGSLSFKPEPADKGVRAILKRLPGGQALRGNAAVSYDVENLEQTNEPAPAWKGEYRYDQLHSNIPGADYKANVFLVGLKLQR